MKKAENKRRKLVSRILACVIIIAMFAGNVTISMALTGRTPFTTGPISPDTNVLNNEIVLPSTAATPSGITTSGSGITTSGSALDAEIMDRFTGKARGDGSGAGLKGVKYSFQEAVQEVDLSKYFTSQETLKAPEGINIAPGTVLVDKKKQTAAFVELQGADGTLKTRQPTMNEVFSYFEIPEQKVHLNEDNLFDMQPAIRDARLGKTTPGQAGTVTLSKAQFKTSDGSKNRGAASAGTEKDIVQKAASGGINQHFDATPLDAYLGDGQKMTITVSGDIGINMDLIANYSAFSGYKFGVEGAEYLDLKLVTEMNLKQELYIPIVGFNIPCGGIAGLRAGLFVVVGVDGNIRLVVTGEEGVSMKAGIKGDTFFCVPTSFKPFAEKHNYAAADADFGGQVKAGVYLTPSISLKALGIQVIGAEIRVGFYGYATASDELLDYGLDAVARFDIAVLGHHKNIFNIQYSLFRRQREFHNGYWFYGNLCAYRDNLLACVMRNVGANEKVDPQLMPDPIFGSKAYYAGPINIIYYRAGNTTEPAATVKTQMKAEDKGMLSYNFNTDGINICKGDSVVLQVPDKALGSHWFATFPFSAISLEKADFFNEVAYGQVEPASNQRDLPGMAKKEVKSGTAPREMIYCAKRYIDLTFTDPSGKAPSYKISVKTGDDGKFTADDTTAGKKLDIRPYWKVTPSADIDGFTFTGKTIDTETGIDLEMVSDYRSNYACQIIDGNGKTKNITSNRALLDKEQDMNKEELCPHLSEEYISGDHFIAINEYGSKTIDTTLNYETAMYAVPADIDSLAFHCTDGIRVYPDGTMLKVLDIRDLIMKDSTPKTLIYKEGKNLHLYKGGNPQLAYFSGDALEKAKAALQNLQAVSSTHAYHDIMMKAPDATGKLGVKTPMNDDCVDYEQPYGPDAIITLSNYFADSDGKTFWHSKTGQQQFYVDSFGWIDIEGYHQGAVQSEPWVYEKWQEGGETGSTADKKMNQLVMEGMNYSRKYIVNPAAFDMHAGWAPAKVEHSLRLDSRKGLGWVDGVQTKLSDNMKTQNGKLYISVSSVAGLMGAAVSADSLNKDVCVKRGAQSVSISLKGQSVRTVTAADSRSAKPRSITLKNKIAENGPNDMWMEINDFANCMGLSSTQKPDGSYLMKY